MTNKQTNDDIDELSTAEEIFTIESDDEVLDIGGFCHGKGTIQLDAAHVLSDTNPHLEVNNKRDRLDVEEELVSRNVNDDTNSKVLSYQDESQV